MDLLASPEELKKWLLFICPLDHFVNQYLNLDISSKFDPRLSYEITTTTAKAKFITLCRLQNTTIRIGSKSLPFKIKHQISFGAISNHTNPCLATRY